MMTNIASAYTHVNSQRLYLKPVRFIAMSYDKVGFSRRLMEICDDKGIPEKQRQNELIKITKKKQPSVHAWLTGKTLPEPENMAKIIKWGNTTCDWLLFERGQKYPERLNDDLPTNQLLKFFLGLQGADQDFLVTTAKRLYELMHPEKAPDGPTETANMKPRKNSSTPWIKTKDYEGPDRRQADKPFRGRDQRSKPNKKGRK